MVEIVRRTYPQLTAQTTVQDTDLLASYRGIGPLKKLGASVLKDYVLTDSGDASFTLNFTDAVDRTLLERFESQPANLLDFYDAADGANYAPALTRACAAKFAVYVPAGSYPLLDKVTMATDGNFIFGDGVTESVFTVTSATFNMSATAVIECPTSASENHAGLHDIGITFTQPSTSTRASFVQYPYAFKARGVARLLIGNIRVTGGYNGLDLRDNTGGLMGGRWELGCINESITGGGATGGTSALDFWHVDTVHVWPFGFQDATRLVAWQDGNTIGARLGRIDGLDIKTLSTFSARNILENTSGEGPFGTISSCEMDGRLSRLEIANCRLAIGAFYSTTDLTGDYAIRISAGHLSVGASWVVGPGLGSQPLFDVQGGYLTVSSAVFVTGSTYPAASVTNGELTISGGSIIGQTNATLTAPTLRQVSGTMAIGDAFALSPVGAGSGVAVLFTTDNAGNYFNQRRLNGWSITLPTQPTSGYAGDYGQPVRKNRTIAAADPLPILASDEELTVTGNTNFGTWQTTYVGHEIVVNFTGTPILSVSPSNNEFSGLQPIYARSGLQLHMQMTGTGWKEISRTYNDAAAGWAQTAPTVTAATGSFTTVASVMRSRLSAYDICEFTITITVTDAGTATNTIFVSLPYAARARSSFAASEQALGDPGLVAYCDAASSTLNILKVDGTSVALNGAVIVVTGQYEINR